jgi:hypothetical protein
VGVMRGRTFGAGLALPIAEDHQGLFNALTTPRDGLFSYPVKGRRLAKDMTEVLEDLKARYIDQNTLHPPQSMEAGMTSEILNVLRRAGLADVFDRDVKVGPVSYKVNFPIAQMRGDDRADRVIKPLNFAGKTPTEIYNHGDEWLRKLQRLKTLGFHPAHSLFAIRKPSGELELQAFQQIRDEFLERDIVLADEMDEAKVLGFAKSAQLRLPSL